MAITNKQQLAASIKAWIERDDLDERIDDFIQLAERKIFRELRTPANERTVLLDRAAGAGDEMLIPEHLLEVRKLIVNGVALKRITDEQYYSLPAKSGQPTHFFRYANRYKVWPTPDVASRWVLSFYSDFELDDDNPSNTVLQVAPDLYLFGALCEAEPFLMNDQRVALWEAKFTNNLEALNDMARRADLSGSASIQGSAY